MSTLVKSDILNNSCIVDSYSHYLNFFCLAGFISLLVFVCVLAGSVTFVSIILLAVYPESLQGATLNIYPNDTILAVPDAGLDPGRINYVLYKYYGVEQEHHQNIDDRLLLYKLQCNNLKPQSRVADINISSTLPQNVSIVEIDHPYLLTGSSIRYQINITLLSKVPPHCYARLILNNEPSNEEAEEICNSTVASLTVTATRNGYVLPLLILYKDVQLKAIHIKASGTVYYYDVVQSKAELVCEIDPPTNTRCSIPIRNNANQIGSSSNTVCILAVRESSYTSESSEFEYYTASFSYGQVILIMLICVGFVSFVCMCGLSISLCTKPGRRLREALHMSSPLNNY